MNRFNPYSTILVKYAVSDSYVYPVYVVAGNGIDIPGKMMALQENTVQAYPL